MVFKVAVIGAGPSGLTSIKACLDEFLCANMFWKQRWHGWTVEVQRKSLHKQVLTTILRLCSQATQLKLHEKIYDVNLKPPFFFFHYVFLPLETSSLQEVSEPNRASIYRSLTIKVSKEMMCYSDFPIPAGYPNYMHHSKILTYFRMYAEHFKLMQYIRFQVTESTSCSAGVYEHSRWCLGHPSGFWQWHASGHEVQHTLCPHLVPALANQHPQSVQAKKVTFKHYNLQQKLQ